MAESAPDELARLKLRLAELLKKVPGPVINGSHDTAVAYKKLAKSALALQASRTPKLATLQQVVSQLNGYEYSF